MVDFRSLYDRDYIYAFDLGGRDVTVKIAKVEAAVLTGSGGRKTRKPVVYFDGKEKGLALCKTNAKTIATLYGNDTEKWVGRSVTLYPTTTMFGVETVDCIRVRPVVPKGNGTAPKPAEPEPREPGQDG